MSYNPGAAAAAKKSAFSIQPRGSSDHFAGKSHSLARRPHRLGHDDDSSDEEQAPVHEEISGFDTLTGAQLTADGRAVSDSNQPLVIPVTSKNNWRDRPGTNVRKSKKNLLPPEVQALQEAQKNGQAQAEGAVEVEGPSMAYGLSFAQTMSKEEGKHIANGVESKSEVQVASTEKSKPMTDDQLALQALLRETTGEVERRTDLVIESSKLQEDETTEPHHDEASSFRADVASRPEPASLDQYNAIPVEEFGAALLRGMGWKDGQSIGRGNYSSSSPAQKTKTTNVPARRPGFLGIGAKDSGKGAEVELGAWGKSAMRKASRKQGEENADGNVEGVYMPVTMRNKRTGEYITEEELAELKKESSKPQIDKERWRDRGDRNLGSSGRAKDGHSREYRERNYSNERSGRKGVSSRRERSSSAGRYSSRRSGHHEDIHRRDERSHRDRQRDYDRDRDRGSARFDSDSRRDRDRERDRKNREDRYESSRHSSHSSRKDGSAYRSRRYD
ncbi:Pre-mRNA-splicing factor spp2 [Penicillium diatomitis]|uniref:Pre-mRNA-splicing factor n=1 Tax=Penicillium diatomitis TaxID=2819901 RepID=A0A9W9X7E5_9EURO|nr:Pre-mRNA-splicing factor spp2 [Penicillium diatomitis]KAJ5485050.1 Pre-mRNA-splicing factor spp2 [Penicillium diatomitis]